MIKLKNLKKNDSLVECDIIPEDSDKAGHLVVDLKSNKTLKYDLPDGYEWCRSHVKHASDVLIRLSKEDSFPEEKLVMWY